MKVKLPVYDINKNKSSVVCGVKMTVFNSVLTVKRTVSGIFTSIVVLGATKI